MALTDRAIQAVQAPLKLVQQVAGQSNGDSGGGEELRRALSSIDELQRTVTAINGRLDTLEGKIDEILDHTDHLRTARAAEAAGKPTKGKAGKTG